MHRDEEDINKFKKIASLWIVVINKILNANKVRNHAMLLPHARELLDECMYVCMYVQIYLSR